jgi:hypothetical protein
MKRTDLAYWLSVVDRLRNLLLGFEPSLFHVNAAFRFIFAFIVVKVAFSALVTIVQLIAFLVDEVLQWVTGAAARWLIFYDFIGVLAPTYVRVEALVLRIMRPVPQVNVLGRNNEGIGGSEWFRVITPRPLGPLNTFLSHERHSRIPSTIRRTACPQWR